MTRSWGVDVVATDKRYAILLSDGESEIDLTPDEARTLAKRARKTGRVPVGGVSIDLDSDGQIETFADDLDVAAGRAFYKSVEEIVGKDAAREYKEGRITAEEFMDIFSEEADRLLGASGGWSR